MKTKLTRRIFVSAPADRWLTPPQQDLKAKLVELVESLAYVPEIFSDPSGRPSLAASQTWNAERMDEVARHCYGALLIGLPRWTFDIADGEVLLPSEFSYYEGALARTLALPVLVVAQANLLKRVVFDELFGRYIGFFPPDADGSWLQTHEFRVVLEYWLRELDRRRDIFLGYSSSSTETAEKLRDFLENDIGATVLDWKRDFKPGRTILEEIEEARVRCTTGIFLFTKDDAIQSPDPRVNAAPRDNVIFEAGYFVSAKGKDKVLIILEEGAKMPADLGGDIYAPLIERSDLQSVQNQLRRFFANP